MPLHPSLLQCRGSGLRPASAQPRSHTLKGSSLAGLSSLFLREIFRRVLRKMMQKSHVYYLPPVTSISHQSHLSPWKSPHCRKWLVPGHTTGAWQGQAGNLNHLVPFLVLPESDTVSCPHSDPQCQGISVCCVSESEHERV